MVPQRRSVHGIKGRMATTAGTIRNANGLSHGTVNAAVTGYGADTLSDNQEVRKFDRQRDHVGVAGS